jgi:hypothetical protein
MQQRHKLAQVVTAQHLQLLEHQLLAAAVAVALPMTAQQQEV